jgi:hypothetical protein
VGGLKTEQGLGATGSYVLRDKNGNIKQTGDVIAQQVERDDEGNIIAFTDEFDTRYEIRGKK